MTNTTPVSTNYLKQILPFDITPHLYVAISFEISNLSIKKN